MAGCVPTGSLREPGGNAPAPRIAFSEVAQANGLTFEHVHGGSGRRYFVETMGSGGAVLDFDRDGWYDIYLLQGQPLPGFEAKSALESRLFRNRRNGTFVDVTAGSGLSSPGYGMGACAADLDADGWVDVYVTAFGPDRLYRNRGDGSFEDWTERAGIDNTLWGAGCAIADYDGDGCLDIYVANYLDSTIENHRSCGSANLPVYCHPDAYPGVPDRLYRNTCDGSFTEVSAEAGIAVSDPSESKGLGVVWLDFDDDGDQDIYVANDSTRNFLFRNRGDGTFEEVGSLLGVAYDELGRTQAGMGLAAADFDLDGAIDLFVTNLDFETNTFYRNLGGGLFEDQTVAAGLAGPSLTRVGFGANAADFDNDGDVDLFVANGHILDNIASINASLAYAQADQLSINDGSGRFEVLVPAAGPLTEPTVARGSAVVDVDNDGDRDLLVTSSNGPVRLLRNDTSQGRSLTVRLLAPTGGDAIGAGVELSYGGRTQTAEVRSGSSYLMSEDPRLHFGLGAMVGSSLAMLVRWPSGESTGFTIPEPATSSTICIEQDQGVIPCPRPWTP